jgi:hypothetical protein
VTEVLSKEFIIIPRIKWNPKITRICGTHQRPFQEESL